MKRRPTWQVYHNLGESVAPRLDVHDSFEKIGKHLGCRKQKVYHEAMVALGKIIYRLRQSMPKENL